MLIITPSGKKEEFNPDKIKSVFQELADKADLKLTKKQYDELVKHVQRNATYLFQSEIDYTIINDYIAKALNKHQPSLLAMFTSTI